MTTRLPENDDDTRQGLARGRMGWSTAVFVALGAALLLAVVVGVSGGLRDAVWAADRGPVPLFEQDVMRAAPSRAAPGDRITLTQRDLFPDSPDRADRAFTRERAPSPPVRPQSTAPQADQDQTLFPDSGVRTRPDDPGFGGAGGVESILQSPETRRSLGAVDRAPLRRGPIRPIGPDEPLFPERAGGSVELPPIEPRGGIGRIGSDSAIRSLFGTPQTDERDRVARSDVDHRIAETHRAYRSNLTPAPSTTMAGYMFSNRDAATFLAWLPSGRRSGPGTLVFSIRNSADTLPGSSQVTVRVNGEDVAEVGTAADGRGRRVAIDIPDRFLNDGYNTIEFLSLLYHRVSCTVESGYDTWVEIPADGAYLAYDLNGGLDHTDIMGWLGHAAQGRALPVYSPGQSPRDTVIRAGFGFSQGVSVSTGTEAFPLVSLPLSLLRSPDPIRSVPEFPGIDLARMENHIAIVMGTVADLSGTVSRELLAQVDGPHFSTHQFDDQIVVLISGRSGADLAYATHSFAEAVSHDQPPWRYATLIRSNMARDWASLGGRTESVYGPLYRSRVSVQLPPDMASTQEQAATLYLNLAYGAGLAPGAEMLVMVNGRTAAAFAFDKSDGHLLENQPISLPMRYFRPGANLIELEARLPYVDDNRCFWLGGPSAEGRPRMTLFDDTRIQFPSFGQITLLPDLRLFTEEALPYSTIGRLPVFLTDADHATVSAAWSLTGALSARSGIVLPVDLRVGAQPGLDEHALVFGRAGTLPPIVRERGTEDFQAVLANWGDRGVGRFDDGIGPSFERERDTDETDTVIDNLRRLRVSGSNAGDRASDGLSLAMIDSRVARGGAPADSSTVWTRRSDLTTVERADWRDRLSEDQGGGLSVAMAWLQGIGNAIIRQAYTNTADFRMPIWAEVDRRETDLRRSADFMISQFSPRAWGSVVPGFSSATWTVVTAPDIDRLRNGIGQLNRIDSINGVGGDTALFDLSSGAIDLRKSTDDYIFTGQRPAGISLLRAYFGQWFSLHTGIWISFSIALVIFVGLLTNSLSRRVGQREELQ